MGVLSYPRSALGPIVEVELSPGAEARNELSSNLRPLPQPVVIKLLVDTGADCTAIDEGVIDHWMIGYVRAGWAHTWNGSKPMRMYQLDVKVASGDPLTTWSVEGIIVSARRDRFGDLPYQGLLGRDMIDRCVFAYDGPAYRFTLTY